jgi:hypothetical protein
MQPVFVRIGDRFFNLNTILWAQIEEYAGIQSLVLVYRAQPDSKHESFRVGGKTAQQMISILEQFTPEPR